MKISSNENYLSRKNARELLSFNYSQMRDCIEEGYIKEYYIESNKEAVFKKSEIQELLKKREKFFELYVTTEEAREYLSEGVVNKLPKISVPAYARYGKFFQRIKAIKKSVVQETVKNIDNPKRIQLDNEIDLNNYYSVSDSLNLLQISRPIFRNVCLEKNIKPIFRGRLAYYDKKIIDELKMEQESLINEYKGCITYEKALEKYPKDTILKVKKYRIVPLLKGVFPNTMTVYKENDILDILDKRSSMLKFQSMTNDKWDELFVEKLSLFEEKHSEKILSLKEKSTLSYNQWISFSKRKLGVRRGRDENAISCVNQYIYTMETLYDILNVNGKDEAYQLITKEIIDALADTGAVRAAILMDFFDTISSEAKEYKVNYNIIELKRRQKSKSSKVFKLIDAEIYSEKEYLGCLKHCMETSFHAKKSIQEIQNKNKCSYVSTWVYVLLHLNNMWRSADIRHLEYVNINDLINNIGIFDIEWFLDNELDIQISLIIKNCYFNRISTISKNKEIDQIRCSEDLAISFATAVSILSLYYSKSNLLIDKKIKLLMDFSTKNNKVTHAMLRKFFDGFSIEDEKFTFKSKKMNSTLSTMIYNLGRNENADNALNFSKLMRKHKSSTSTLHYLNFDMEQINLLSRQLFMRGEFGYVYDLLVSNMPIESDSSEKFPHLEARTEAIMEVKSKISSVFQLELICGFLNGYNQQRNEVIKYITDLDANKRIEILDKLYTGKLNSKENNIKCLVSGNCRDKYQNKCKYCNYSIPTIYAATEICKDTLAHIKAYNAEELVGEKIRWSVLINHDLILISELIYKYGKDYVYSIMEMNREDFKDLVTEVDKPLELLQLKNPNI